MGWISHASMVGICYKYGMSVGILVLLQWSPFSISNKHYTTQSAAVRVIQKDVWYGNNIMGGDYTQQYINSRGIVIFFTDDLAYEREWR